MVGKWKAAVFAIACRKLGSVVSASVLGMAVCWFTRQSRDSLREDMVWIKIRVMAVVAVARPPAGVDGKLRQIGEPTVRSRLVLTPVAVLPIRVRNGSRFAGAAPLETRYAFRNCGE